jgi:phosphoribosyl 1,2-cyclic phosphate phosphodiesterase
LEKTLEWIAQAQPKRAILTNMHVDLDYATLQAELPDSVVPAFDTMTAVF